MQTRDPDDHDQPSGPTETEIATVTDPAEIPAIAAAIAGHGSMAMDIEFASEDRYIPELALVQLAWGERDEPDVAIIDFPAVGEDAMAPIFTLIERDDIDTYSHAARQDLGLLITRYQVRAEAFWDTQIAALFAGHGEQVGYATLVHKLLGITLDKSSQYTDWLARPLSHTKLRYAYADVAHLPAVWATLRTELEACGRLEWVRAESDALARAVTPPAEPEVAYMDVKGWRGLDGRALGSLQALAEWRQERALDKNLPLSWVLPDKAMISLCRSQVRTERALMATRGVDKGVVRRHGRTILRRIAQGARNRKRVVNDAKGGHRPSMSARASLRASIATSLVSALAADAGLPGHLLVERDDIERLAAWADEGAQGQVPDVTLARGWRREVAGDALISWLRGECAIAVDASEGGLGLVTRESD